MNNKKFKILLVEDDIGAQQMLALNLTHKFDCEVFVASTGEEAVQMASNNIYDLIFMDIGLPGIDGVEATANIRQLVSVNHQTPIVALTAHTDKHTRQRCDDVSMDDFLAKPFDNSEIKKVLMKFKLVTDG